MGFRSAWKQDGIDRLESELDRYKDLYDTYHDQEYADMIKIITEELEKAKADLEELEN